MQKVPCNLEQLGKKLLNASVAVLLLTVTACNNNDEAEPNQMGPTGPKPEGAPNIDNKMLAVIEQLQSYGTPPLVELSA